VEQRPGDSQGRDLTHEKSRKDPRLARGEPDEAVRTGRNITWIALAFEAGRDGFWLDLWRLILFRRIPEYPVSGTDGSNPPSSSDESHEPEQSGRSLKVRGRPEFRLPPAESPRLINTNGPGAEGQRNIFSHGRAADWDDLDSYYARDHPSTAWRRRFRIEQAAIAAGRTLLKPKARCREANQASQTAKASGEPGQER
jgi:hypothetical protein